MTQEEKLSLIADVLMVEDGVLTPETELATLDAYDSMAKLSIIVMMDDECHKKLTGEQLREFKTIGDMLAFMG